MADLEKRRFLLALGASAAVAAASHPMPAIARSLGTRRAMDNAQFRVAVREGRDVSAALSALCTSGGRLLLPDQGEHMVLSSRVQVTASGLHLEGVPSVGHATLFRLARPGAGIDFVGVQESGITGAAIFGDETLWSDASFALGFVRSRAANCYGCYASKLWLERCANGIDVDAATNTELGNGGKIEIRELFGTSGIRFHGSGPDQRADKLVVRNLVADAPYPFEAHARNWAGPMQPATEYNRGDVAVFDGRIYQCIASGSTDAAGFAPSQQNVAAREFPDGAVVWRFVCSAGLAWILQQGYAYSLDCADGAMINGAYGFRMLGADARDGYPRWAYFTNVDIDHSAIVGAELAAGEDFSGSQLWVSSVLSGPGVAFAGSYRGEGGIHQSNIRGNAQEGVVLAAGRGVAVSGNKFVNNGQERQGGYDNIRVGAGISGFHVTDNQFLPETGQKRQNPRHPLTIEPGGSDGYVVTGNLASGHAVSDEIVDGGRGRNKTVSDNHGF